MTEKSSLPSRGYFSPFRYPGGKSWLVPTIRSWLKQKSPKPTHFIEPFAGGASVGLTVAVEDLAEKVMLVEMDRAVASVWKVILNGEDNADLLIDRIKNFELSEKSVDIELARQPKSLNDLAFQTILWNRVSRGGLLAPGSGLLRKGEDGKGLASRWYPETLAVRIKYLMGFRTKIRFNEGDGLLIIDRMKEETSTVFFVDPPYSATSKGAGRRLYTVSDLDHAALFSSLVHIKGDFLATYDDDPAVRELASTHGFDVHPIPVRNSHHSIKNELLIGKDLTSIRKVLGEPAYP